MKRIIILVLAIAATMFAFAQNDNPKVKYHHMIRTGLSFAPGFMLNGMSNVYISGVLEYYIADRVSISSTAYYFLNSRKEAMPELKMNHQLYTGVQYHLLKDRAFDPYIGLEPGFALTQTKDVYPLDVEAPVYMMEVRESNISANPMLSLDAGFNIYAVKFFHLFVNLRYATGKHLGGPTAYNLSEFTTSFGLGLNANFFNRKKK
jgi:hypothetical protein